MSVELSTEGLRAQIETMTQQCRDAFDEVEGAIESGEKERQLAAGRMVDDLAEHYRRFRDAQTGPARQQVERALDRRLTDLRRTAAGLVQRIGGHRAQRAADAGFVPFLEQRSPSSGPAPAEWPTLQPKRLGVGAEIESWCGKCKDMRTHGIVAMVGEEPKQVICQTCGSKHNHRAEPPLRARTTQSGEAEPSTSGRERTRREELRRDLQRELNASIEVRAFDPKDTYARGEIISHPQYGRGKIENVLNGSILVRFLEGLRPLDTR